MKKKQKNITVINETAILWIQVELLFDLNVI